MDEHRTRRLVGLVGFGSVGKDTIARYLVDKYHFTHVSSGDLVRSYMKEHALGSQTRDALQKTANELREKNGADYLTVRALENKADSLIISGLRAVAEVRRLKEEGGFIIALTAPPELRYKWASSRGGATDHVTFAQFKEIEAREAQSNSEVTQNINAVLSMADATIVNDGTRNHLYEEIDTLMKRTFA